MRREDWIGSCRAFGHARGVDERIVGALDAFGGPTDGPRPGFQGLLEDARASLGRLSRRVVDTLGREVDEAQARMFARRLVDVAGILRRVDGDEARILEVGLARRVGRVLRDPAPRALRVRAVIDYYYSQAAVVFHSGETRSFDELAGSARWEALAPGVHHATLQGPGPRGPVHINVLRLTRGRFEALDCRGASLKQRVRRSGAVAGLSGGFFLYSEPDIAAPARRTDPVGLLVHAGEVVEPPLLRRSALIQDYGDNWRIDRIGPVGTRVLGHVVGACNDRLARPPVVFQRAWGQRSPDRPELAVAIAAGRVVAVGRQLEIPVAGCVMLLPEGARAAVGDPVDYRLADEAIAEAMGGGPLLVEGGAAVDLDLVGEDFRGTAPPVTFSRDETFDQNLLPRMAAGITASGELIFAAVDGRNFDRAPGLTLGLTAGLMVSLGCERAMNLDGGSSKRMIVGDRVVDLPSTEVVAAGSEGGAVRVRPVHSAILVFAP